MSEFVTTSSADRVAYDHRRADGPTVIFVPGAGPWRAVDPVTTQTAELLLAEGIGSIVYDRVGRGESAVPGAVSLQREVAALHALSDQVEGPVALCGHSSGCAIALYAVTHGVTVNGLALWEAPFGPPHSGANQWSSEIIQMLDREDLEGALRHFMRDIPPEILDGVMQTPGMIEQAGALRADAEALAWIDSAALPELLGDIEAPVLALVGEQTYDFMTTAAASIAEAVRHGTSTPTPGSNHSWEPHNFVQQLRNFVG